MNTTSSCPSIQDLIRLALNRVPDDEAARLRQHLASCPACRRALDDVDSRGTLVQQLQARATETDRPVKELIESLLRRIEAAPRAEPGPTVPAQPQVPNTRSYDFLQHGTGLEELGWLGGYRLLKVLGTGGMGIVFQAEDPHLQRLVALKVMKPDRVKDLAARQRFLREARAAAALKHDHIVTIYQVGQENDVPFLAMEFLEGESLESRLMRQGRLPLLDAIRIAREVAEGLALAHDHKLIHRDIKPANIWLETLPTPAGEPPRWRAKILDFGLARPAENAPHLTGTGFIVGTPEYMAPEQARGKPLDGRCDLFSLGVVLYEMCTGRLPFQGDDTMALLTSLVTDEPRPLREVSPDVPHALADLVKQLLAKKPEQRPASARVVAETLRALEQSVARQDERMARATTLGEAVPRGPRLRSRRVLLTASIAVLFLATSSLLAWRGRAGRQPGTPPPPPTVATVAGPPIRVGILHSTSGTFADSCSPVVDATRLALEELNERGGLLGRRIEWDLRDGQSDDEVFEREALDLLSQGKVCAIFGCWTSSSRKTLLPLLEKYDSLLVYPVQYEGLELSPYVVYNGATPNQQIIPAVQYCFGFLNKRRFFLVGSDYVFPHTANAIIQEELKDLGAQVAGVAYRPLGSTDFTAVIQAIRESKADVILNTINGSSNPVFFRELRAAGISPDQVPTVSFSVNENELRSLRHKDLTGDYAAWNYFQSVQRPENEAFIRRFRTRYGSERLLSDPMEAAYFGVHLWAQAVVAAGSEAAPAVRQAIRDQRYEAPGGAVRIDPKTLHTWKTFRMGRINSEGQFDVIFGSGGPLEPQPYPRWRTPDEWNRFLRNLYEEWGGHWSRPGS